MQIQHFSLQKIKHLVRVQIFKTILICIATVLGLFAITFVVVWFNRGRIFRYFANDYARMVASEQSKASLAGDFSKVAGEQALQIPAVFSNQSLVENAVQQANPAVVAISISKSVPKYTTTYNQVNPFGDLFGGTNPFGNMLFNVPTQTPDGYEKKEIGGGSGFLVSSDGLIVTNRHVVSDKDAEYTVYLSNGKKYSATVLARDAVLDVAIVKITASGLPYLSLGNSDNLKLGQTVIAIGNALAQFQNTISVGVVSGLSRSVTAGDGEGSSEALDHVIQTDAAINPGNSGGPLLDLSGNVIGVDTAIVQGSQNIGFALPINSIKTVIESVRATGKIVRPYLGIRYEVVTDDVKDTNHLTVDYGAIVQRGKDSKQLAVVPGSPADKAGIVENDIVLEVDGTKIDEDHDLAQMIRAKHVGDVVVLKLLSKGAEKTVNVTLAAAPQE